MGNRTQSLAKADGSYGVTYLYYGDGQRVGQASAATATYYFAGGAYEVTAAVPSNTVTSTKKYYSLAGQMVAMEDGSGLKYFLQDHLGSVVAVLGADGNIITGSEQRYLPFGQVRTNKGNITQTDFGYTGQRDLDSTGLMDYKARFYDASLNRFLQPDTVVPGAFNPQSSNRYAYAFNSPLKYSDPDGHCPICLIAIVAGIALVGAAISMDQINTGVQELNWVSQQPELAHEQAVVQQWQNDCMGQCHYSQSVDQSSGFHVVGPRPETPYIDIHNNATWNITQGVVGLVGSALELAGAAVAANKLMSFNQYLRQN